MNPSRSRLCVLAPLLVVLQACDATPSELDDLRSVQTSPSILSAYFAFDNGAGIAQNAGCDPYLGFQDGMPVVFDVEIDQDTLAPSDFRVTYLDRQGRVVRTTPRCVGLPPAGDEAEDRTVLMVGQFGGGETVLRVEVVDALMDEDGRSLQGVSIDDVTSLNVGPTMVYAESLPSPEWTLDHDGSQTECPLNTVQIVQVTWQAGITNVTNDGELGDFEREAYVVTLEDDDGTPFEVTPYALGDLTDGDNNNDLCLDVPGTPIEVAMRADIVSDPGGVPNRDSRVMVRTQD